MTPRKVIVWVNVHIDGFKRHSTFNVNIHLNQERDRK